MVNSKHETQNAKQIQNYETQRDKTYNLSIRTLKFAKDVRDYEKDLSKNLCNLEYGKQLIRSSVSVGANYLEAEDSISKKDFYLRMKISRKEAKESRYWLELTETKENNTKKQILINEALELTKIFGAIVEKSK